jgi:DNA-binding response OmpR family regulator
VSGWETLLSSPEVSLSWPFEGRVLLVDSDAGNAVAETSIAGSPGWATRSKDEAVRLLRNDESIRVVLVDYELGVTATLVWAVRTLRPDVLVVGTSVDDRWEEFHDLGVDRFLMKPFEPRAFVAALAPPGRI